MLINGNSANYKNNYTLEREIMSQFISWSKSTYRYYSEAMTLTDAEDLIVQTGYLANHHSFTLDPLTATAGIAQIHVQYDGQGFYTNTGLVFDVTDSNTHILSFTGSIVNIKLVVTLNFNADVIVSLSGIPAIDSSAEVADIQSKILPQNWIVSNPDHKIYTGSHVAALTLANQVLFSIEVPLNTSVTYEGIVNAYDDSVEARWFRDRGLLVNNAGVISHIGSGTAAGPVSVNGRTVGGGRFVMTYTQNGNYIDVVISSSNNLTTSKYSWNYTVVGG